MQDGFSEIIDQAKATSILDVISARVELKRKGKEYVGRCPFHADSTPSFYVVPAKRFFYCFGCMAKGSVIDFVKQYDDVDFVEACRRITGNFAVVKRQPMPVPSAEDERRERDQKIARCIKLWREAVPARGTIAEIYLRSRGIKIEPPQSLRFHPGVYHKESGRHGPAMVAAVQGLDGHITGVHRTWLRADGGGKADLKPNKKGYGLWVGGHIRLAARGPQLAIAEGIETAMSVMMAKPGLPCWAALWIGNLGAAVPEEVKEVLICADNDSEDKDRAMHREIVRKAATRLSDTGKRVRIVYPPEGNDFNDWLVTLERGRHV